jgi:hypothetical protein
MSYGPSITRPAGDVVANSKGCVDNVDTMGDHDDDFIIIHNITTTEFVETFQAEI